MVDDSPLCIFDGMARVFLTVVVLEGGQKEIGGVGRPNIMSRCGEKLYCELVGTDVDCRLYYLSLHTVFLQKGFEFGQFDIPLVHRREVLLLALLSFFCGSSGSIRAWFGRLVKVLGNYVCRLLFREEGKKK